MYTGKKARDMIGLPHNETKTLSPRTMSLDPNKFNIFIQSTSYNRKLKQNTKFLYEVDMTA